VKALILSGKEAAGFESLPLPYTFSVQVFRILQTLKPFNFFLMNPKAYMGKKQSRIGVHLYFFFVGIILTPILVCGCSHLDKGYQARVTFKEANDFVSQGNYKAALNKYEQILEKYPKAEDRVLFERGIIYAHPKNEEKNYQKSLECFQKLITDYPESGYKKDSEIMIFQIHNVTFKDQTVAAQQAQIEALRQAQVEALRQKDQTAAAQQAQIAARQAQIEALQQEGKSKENEVLALQKKIEELEQKVFALQMGPVDKILIEKKKRRLTLILKDEALKTYKIALGGNPEGPKERQGDNKTPEGFYFIDSRNRNSRYHLSLHISYPNEKDKRRAKELGVSPGGDIMIHGIKNGFSWVGDLHTEVDWTKGCIAVTDEEIVEIEKLAPNGTMVEIRP
jgi:tetratricopeptide (TPR) repeat protein